MVGTGPSVATELLAADDWAVALDDVSGEGAVPVDLGAGLTAPTFISGVVTDVDGSTVTVDDGDGAGGSGGATASAATVDLAGVPVSFDGDAGHAAKDLVRGDWIMVVGSSGAAGFTPSMAMAYSSH